MVELCQDAKDAVFEALNNGKDVITANKALLAEHLPAILELVDAKGVTMGAAALLWLLLVTSLAACDSLLFA